jgi:hypothetical protein
MGKLPPRIFFRCPDLSVAIGQPLHRHLQPVEGECRILQLAPGGGNFGSLLFSETAVS